MYNQAEWIFSNYEIEIHGIIKGRGTYICETGNGKKVLTPFRGSKEKGKLLHDSLQTLAESGFMVEQIELNKNQEAVTEDENTGERFVLKNYVEGTEVSTERLEDMKEAVKVLAIFHNASAKINPVISSYIQRESVVEQYQRHNRELIKARNYIRNKKKRSEFEQIYMKNYEKNRLLADRSLHILEQQAKGTEENYLFCHGDYNQHNIVLTAGRYQIVNFENFSFNWAMTDLANFLRKMLEKNNWEERIGKELISTYESYRRMEKREYAQLYGLLLFPEKFWKVTNHYMNSRKTWISGKEIDKLKRVMEQEEQRLNFMENIFSFPKE